MDSIECKTCKKIKEIDEFYSQKKHSKVRGEYIYYNPECKECASERSMRWTGDNKERAREIDNRYYKSKKGKENKARKSESRKSENGKLYFKNYQKNNLDKFTVYNQKRRSMKNQLETNFTVEDWNNCLKHFNYCCAYCGMSETENVDKFNQKLEQEHVIPVTKGGGYTVDNIIPSCRSCNASKYNNDVLEWYEIQDFFSESKRDEIFFYLDKFREEGGELKYA